MIEPLALLLGLLKMSDAVLRQNMDGMEIGGGNGILAMIGGFMLFVAWLSNAMS